ncbi:hypothetical protein MDA_GLEAN10019324 [Myotis davidii]|uniref:Uncharacterized protein n=1 Tax=Myotis davidii TaxID=225400 RepID=L5LKY1_MYODS|nr:hypothetical protein MDA_GLEAN10019324 [Myotis davidii]
MAPGAPSSRYLLTAPGVQSHGLVLLNPGQANFRDTGKGAEGAQGPRTDLAHRPQGSANQNSYHPLFSLLTSPVFPRPGRHSSLRSSSLTEDAEAQRRIPLQGAQCLPVTKRPRKQEAPPLSPGADASEQDSGYLVLPGRNPLPPGATGQHPALQRQQAAHAQQQAHLLAARRGGGPALSIPRTDAALSPSRAGLGRAGVVDPLGSGLPRDSGSPC